MTTRKQQLVKKSDEELDAIIVDTKKRLRKELLRREQLLRDIKLIEVELEKLSVEKDMEAIEDIRKKIMEQ